MVNTLLLKVGVPMRDQLLTQIVSLVDQKYEVLLVFAYFVDVFLQIFRVEEVWVPGVHYLEQKVRLLDDTPKLAPYVDIFLEGSDC